MRVALDFVILSVAKRRFSTADWLVICFFLVSKAKHFDRYAAECPSKSKAFTRAAHESS